MTIDDIYDILREVDYKPGWHIDIMAEPDGGRPYLQVRIDERSAAAICARTGAIEIWKGGKVYLSPHMCRQEIVGAAFGAFKSAEDHELREWFKYRGVAIYDPHLDPDKLVAFAADPANRNVRT